MLSTSVSRKIITGMAELPVAKDLVEATFALMKEYCTHASNLPTEEFEYHSAFRGFSKCVSSHAEAMLELMDACARQVPRKRRVVFSSKGGLNPAQRHAAAMEAVDSLLETVDSLLDASKGHKLHGDDQLQVAFGSSIASGTTAHQGGSRAVVKPQLAFKEPVDNSLAPFRAKVYAADGSFVLCAAGVHPYQKAIESFSYPAWQVLPSSDVPYLPLDVTPLTFVDTAAALDEMIAALALEREFAVDLEHHDFHSYQGITCLMQVSTRSQDFIVDCLQLRDVMHRLNSVFLNPGILKVFHGAKEDIRWLQKDFCVYVANMFDTGIALQTLHMPHGLAFAVDHFCQVRLDKKYQLADWRIRPLPADMVHYARQDTHYLLYCYDRLKALLLHSEGRASVGNLLVYVLEDSRRLCLTKYERPEFNPNESYKDAMGRSLGGLRPVQTEVLRRVFNWRDAAARDADESCPAIMHAAAVLQIAAKLPTCARDVLSCCKPVSMVVRRDVAHIVEIVTSALNESGEAVGDGGVEGVAVASNSLSGQRSYLPVSGTYAPMTGSLPTAAWCDPRSVDHVIASRPHAAVTLQSGVEPSRWFSAMVAHAAVLREVQAPLVQLPGHATTMRLKLQAKPAPVKQDSASTPTELDPFPPQLDLEECVPLGRDDEEAIALDPVQDGASVSSPINAADVQEGEAASSTQPGGKSEPTSLYEEFGSGRSNRRLIAKKKRDRE